MLIVLHETMDKTLENQSNSNKVSYSYCFYLMAIEGSEVEMLNLIVTGVIKENEVTERFLKANPSEKLFQTEIEDIQPNCVVLMIKVRGQSLQSKDQFMEKMFKFLVNALTPEEENEFPNLTIDTVIIDIADRITLNLNKKFDLKSQDDGYLDISDWTILTTKMVFTDSKGLIIYDTTSNDIDYIPLPEKTTICDRDRQRYSSSIIGIGLEH
ncbi:unnamed protein product [Mytilus coruscus]|uniref:Uncharacterized protein n=1 Tax=Mytilus coruscus TaxID=42192 RepID=A0A6J8BKK2_MYTCO|nr:unnamed protein product [Mytilus coruscus]